jgi:AraC-like DNA-binding protein
MRQLSSPSPDPPSPNPPNRPSHRGQTKFAVPRALLLALHQEGVDAAAVLRAATLPPDAPERGRCLSWGELVALVAAAVRVVGDESFAVRVSAAIRPEAFGMVGLLAMSAATFGQALHGMARYKRLLADQQLTVEVTGGRAVIGLPFLEHGPPGLHHLVESECAFIVHFGRWATKRWIVPLAIHVRHGWSRGTEALAEVTGGSVLCERSRDEVILSAEVLDYALVSANPSVTAALTGPAEDLLAIEVGEETITARVQATLRQQRGGFLLVIEDVARLLGMSARSLQRRLREEGTSFQEVVDTTRKALAVEQMRKSRLQAEELAFILGFSHMNSFYRAFRRWTGMTPIEYRAVGAGDTMAPGSGSRR